MGGKNPIGLYRLCHMIPRFRDVSGGAIKIGGADIRFGKPDTTFEEVRAAAKAARCDDFIAARKEAVGWKLMA